VDWSYFISLEKMPRERKGILDKSLDYEFEGKEEMVFFLCRTVQLKREKGKSRSKIPRQADGREGKKRFTSC